MRQLANFRVRIVLMISLTITAFLTPLKLGLATASPLHTDLNNVLVPLSALSFSDSQWTLTHLGKKELLDRFNTLDNESYNWYIDPARCLPTRDQQNVNRIKNIINTSVSEVFSDPKLHKNLLFALSPDNSNINELMSIIKKRLTNCSAISAHTLDFFPANQTTALASVTPFQLPVVAKADKVYAYRIHISLNPPRPGQLRLTDLNGVQTRVDSLQDIYGTIYLALLRSTWISAIETSLNNSTEELSPMFTRQIELINSAA